MNYRAQFSLFIRWHGARRSKWHQCTIRHLACVSDHMSRWVELEIPLRGQGWQVDRLAGKYLCLGDWVYIYSNYNRVIFSQKYNHKRLHIIARLANWSLKFHSRFLYMLQCNSWKKQLIKQYIGHRQMTEWYKWQQYTMRHLASVSDHMSGWLATEMSLCGQIKAEVSFKRLYRLTIGNSVANMKCCFGICLRVSFKFVSCHVAMSCYRQVYHITMIIQLRVTHWGRLTHICVS